MAHSLTEILPCLGYSSNWVVTFYDHLQVASRSRYKARTKWTFPKPWNHRLVWFVDEMSCSRRHSHAYYRTKAAIKSGLETFHRQWANVIGHEWIANILTKGDELKLDGGPIGSLFSYCWRSERLLVLHPGTLRYLSGELWDDYTVKVQDNYRNL